MKKRKGFEIKTNHSFKAIKLEKDMKKIAKGIFGYNPKTDPNDPLFGKVSQKETENDKQKE